VGSERAQVDGALLKTHVLQARDATNVDERGGRLDTTLKLDEHVCPARHDTSAPCVLVQEA
jgi:hypothetical protein